MRGTMRGISTEEQEVLKECAGPGRTVREDWPIGWGPYSHLQVGDELSHGDFLRYLLVQALAV